MHTTPPQSTRPHSTALPSHPQLGCPCACVAASSGPKSPVFPRPSFTPALTSTSENVSSQSGCSSSLKPLSPFQGRPGRGHRKQAPRASDRDGSDSLQPLTSQLRRDSASWIRPSNTDLLLRAHFLSLSSPSDLGLWGSARVSVTTRRLTDVFLTVVGTLRSSGHC